MGSHLLKGVRRLDPRLGIDIVEDIWLKDGIPQLNHPGIPSGLPIYEAAGQILAPALVDLYAHSGDPGHEQRETLAELAAAALVGGYAQVGLLPSTDPPLESVEALSALQTKARGIPLQWLPLAAITRKNQTLTELGELGSAAIAGFCQDRPMPPLAMLGRILEYLQPLNKPLLLWAWDPAQVGDGLIYEGEGSLRLGLKGIPVTAETSAVASLLELARHTSTPIHLMRVSCARSLELIAQAQAEGLPITASTTWMHLLFSEEDIQRTDYHPGLRLDPPLGSEANRQDLVSGLEAGILSAIATDHQAYTFEEKTLPFGDAPPGCVGLDLALPLLWQQLVEEGSLSPLRLWECLTVGPWQCLGLDPDAAHPWILFDPQAQNKVKWGSHLWWGDPVRGRVVLNGQGLQ